MDFVEIWLVGLAVVVAAAAIAVPVQIRAARRRWAQQAGAGDTYRAGTVTAREGEPPRQVLQAAIAANVWAAITGLLFVPAGGLFTLALFDRGHLVALASLLVVLSGIVAALAWMATASRLLARDGEAVALARRVATYTYAHHAAAWLLYVALMAMEPNAELLGVVAAMTATCGAGMGLGRLLTRAAATIEQMGDATEAELAIG